MAHISTSKFFNSILGAGEATVQLPSDAQFVEVLGAQQDFLTQAEKEALNAPLSLGMAVEAMANHDCPGLDGIPKEFYNQFGRW